MFHTSVPLLFVLAYRSLNTGLSSQVYKRGSAGIEAAFAKGGMHG